MIWCIDGLGKAGLRVDMCRLRGVSVEGGVGFGRVGGGKGGGMRFKWEVMGGLVLLRGGVVREGEAGGVGRTGGGGGGGGVAELG